MSEKPILFNGEMVRAILDGRKTQTRRVIKFKNTRFPDDNPNTCPDTVAHLDGGGNWIFWSGGDNPALAEFTKKAYPNGEGFICPYGRPGDLLYVRETWAAIWPDVDPVPLEQCEIQYRADNPDAAYPGRWPEEEAKGNPDAPKWRPSIHMPRWASRIKLRVTAVRVERVQDISMMDAMNEGFWDGNTFTEHPSNEEYFIGKFASLWDSINAKRGYSWESNPFVWVVEFVVL